MLDTSRRSFLGGLGALVFSPSIVRSDALMKIAGVPMLIEPHRWMMTYVIGTDQLFLRADYCYSHPLAAVRGIFTPPQSLIDLVTPVMSDSLRKAEKMAREPFRQIHVDYFVPLETRASLFPDSFD